MWRSDATRSAWVRARDWIFMPTRTGRFHGWKLTLYAELLNVTNHYNARHFYSSGIDPSTGQALVETLQGLAVAPTAGAAFPFWTFRACWPLAG